MDPTQVPLRDLHLPMTIGWWPLAPGWWILIGIAMAGFGWLLYRAWLSFRRNRPRRIALKKLSAARWHYEYGAEPVALATEVSDLLRRAEGVQLLATPRVTAPLASMLASGAR